MRGVSNKQLQSRVEVVDLLRGVAILLVLVWHYIQNTGVLLLFGGFGESAHKILVFGWSGVDLFFVISGFLIGGIVLDNRDSDCFYRTFYGRRILRIVPLYAMSLIVFFILLSFVEPQNHQALTWLFGQPLAPWSYLSFTQNAAMVLDNTFGANWIAITWSLAVEEQFYLFLPIFLRLIPKKHVAAFMLIGIVLAPAIRVLVFDGIGPLACYVLFPCRMDSLFVGVLLAQWVRQENRQGFVRAKPALLTAVALLSFSAIVFLGYKGESVFSKNVATFGYSLFAMFYGSVLAISLSERSRAPAAFPGSALLKAAGKGCYSLYMVHQPCVGLCFYFLTTSAPFVRGYDGALVLITAGGATVALAALSWRFIEAPGIVLGHRLSYRSAVLDHVATESA